jgi:PAS domain S-box-containing protein
VPEKSPENIPPNLDGALGKENPGEIDKEHLRQGAVEVVHDTEEGSRAEEELRLSERLHLAIRAARIGIWDWDVVKDKLVWNDGMYDLFGIHKEDFSGASEAWTNSLAPEDVERATAEVNAAMRGEREFESEFRIVWPDASIHFIKANSQTFRDDQGNPVRMVGVNYDITEQKLAEERIAFMQLITMDVAAANDLHSALRVVLRHVSEKTGWALGQAWVPLADRKALECCHAWYAEDPRLKSFVNHSRDTLMQPGVGLPGRVWESRRPLWVRDVTRDSNFPRFKFAEESGLKAALGVPILSSDEVIAVLEFYLRETREEDERLVNLITAVAAQIGLVCSRKLAEEKLRWSEERLRLILDSAAEGIFGVDLEGNCTFCNAASLRLLGYDQQSDLLGHNMHTLIANQHADGTSYPMEECPASQSLKNTKGAFSDSDVFWRKDHTYFPVEYWAYPMFRGGKHLGAVLTFLDITQRKLAEESLRLSEERFAKAFHASPEPITIYRHRDGGLLEVNERWQSVYGYTRAEVVGRTSVELGMLSSDTRDKIRGLLEKQHSLRELEVDLRTKSGEVRNISLSAEQIVINDELCNIFLHRDITERKRAEEELRMSEEKFGKVFRSSPVAIVITRLDNGKVIDVNEAATRFYGYERNEIIGRSMLELDVWVNPQESEALADEIKRAGSVAEREYQFRTRQGEVVIGHYSGELIEVHGEECLLSVLSDITERKQSERELINSREQLRALSESLRRAKEEEGLRISRELHDELGSSLTSLKWSLMSLDKIYSEEAGAAINGKRQTKIEEMVGLVDGTINTVRRISSELRPSVLDDLGLVSAIEWHAQQFQKNTGIICHFDSLVENVDLTREQATTFFRIFQEALTNILRHAQATEVNILIEMDGEFRLEIWDNGRGITDTEKLGISSLGLLGMRERAYSIGAKVEITGNVGIGTRLIIRLPLPATPVESEKAH